MEIINNYNNNNNNKKEREIYYTGFVIIKTNLTDNNE